MVGIREKPVTAHEASLLGFVHFPIDTQPLCLSEHIAELAAQYVQTEKY